MSTTTVTNTSALSAALQTAHAGDTILLAAGAYSGRLYQQCEDQRDRKYYLG